MIVVADASVAVKWFLADALAIFEAAVLGRLKLVQPAHFIAEVAAVLARLKPEEAQDDLHDLLNIERRTADSPEIYATATDLAIRLNHHLFDTLYHALALHTPFRPHDAPRIGRLLKSWHGATELIAACARAACARATFV